LRLTRSSTSSSRDSAKSDRADTGPRRSAEVSARLRARVRRNARTHRPLNLRTDVTRRLVIEALSGVLSDSTNVSTRR
jgi:hypothetical protein